MIYPDIDPEVWSQRYKIKIKHRQCTKCNNLFLANIPVAIKGYRGFQIPLHKCGIEFIRATFVPHDPLLKEQWDKVLFG